MKHQISERRKRTNLEARTGSHPGMAGNPGVPQPGFEPPTMSLKASGFSYSKGLRKPRPVSRGHSSSDSLENMKSLSSETIPPAAWRLAVSWIHENGRRKVEGVGSRERHTPTAQAEPAATSSTLPRKIRHPNAYAEMSGYARPKALHKLESKKRVRSRLGAYA